MANDENLPLVDVPRNHITVEVVNPLKLNFALYQTNQPDKQLAKFTNALPKIRFLVPEGKYTIKLTKDNQTHWIAVPALINSSLQINLSDFHHLKNGYAWIPAGPTIIGDTLGIGSEDERAASIVNISGFFLSTHEINNQQYAEFLSAMGSDIEENWIDLGSRKCGIEKVADKYRPKRGLEKFPVVMVSYYGARAYCQWLSKTTQTTHRLPTEQEWEKAARGPLLSVYSYGDVYTQSKANQESGQLKPVGSYPPSPYGLYDMTGNVFEWMSNQYNPKKPDTTMNQALRSGSFVLDGMYLRNSFRMRQSPEVMTDDIGFRVVRELSSSKSDEKVQ